MALKVIYKVQLQEKWKSNINKRIYMFEGEYNVVSDRGAEFAIMKAKSFALKQRDKGTEGQDDLPFDDSCVEADLLGVSAVMRVDC